MKLLRSLRRALNRNSRRDAEGFDAQRRLITTPTPTILDVGAHRGQTARRYRSLFPHAAIHCFEPFPTSYTALAEAVMGDVNVHTHRLALADSTGARILNVNRSSATNSLLRSDARGGAYWGQDLLDTDATVEVPVTTLDRFCAERSLTHIDILKLDVQGAEYSVLNGALALLAAQAIDIVYMEMITAPTYVGQHDLHEYLALFRAHGYAIFDFYNSVRKSGRLLQTDNIMVAEPFLAYYEMRQRSQ